VEYNYLSGNCGLKVSNVCLGTMVFGTKSSGLPAEQLVPYKETCDVLNRFVELGGNFIDTANVYCDGETEEFIGNWLSSQDRNNIVLATKCRFGQGLSTGLSRRAIMASVEGSLKRLKTDYIDLYQIHCWDAGVPIEETLSTLNDLVRCGKVRYLGGSNLTGWQLQEIFDLNKANGYSQFVSLQQCYNILDRYSELESFEVCRNKGIGILPWSPLKGGLLTGKFKRDATVLPENSRIAFSTKAKLARFSQAAPDFDKFKNDEDYWKLDELLHKLSQKHGKTVAQVSLRWLLQKHNVTSVIFGARTVKQMEDNLGAAKGWKLTDEDISAIDEASAIENLYPYSFINSANEDRKRTGCPSGRHF